MPKKINLGYLDVEVLRKAIKSGHSALVKGKNNKVYLNLVVWQHEADEYKNTITLQLNGKKEKKSVEGNIYIGNAKPLDEVLTKEEREKLSF